jgi:hypothetical protein
MTPVNFQRMGICVSILLAATALLILQLSWGRSLTASSSDEPMAEASALDKSFYRVEVLP